MDTVGLLVGVRYRDRGAIALDPRLSYPDADRKPQLASVAGSLTPQESELSQEESFSAGLRRLVQEQFGGVTAEMLEASQSDYKLLDEQIVDGNCTRIYGVNAGVNSMVFRKSLKPARSSKDLVFVNDTGGIQSPPFSASQSSALINPVLAGFEELFGQRNNVLRQIIAENAAQAEEIRKPTVSVIKKIPRVVVPKARSKKKTTVTLKDLQQSSSAERFDELVESGDIIRCPISRRGSGTVVLFDARANVGAFHFDQQSGGKIYCFQVDGNNVNRISPKEYRRLMGKRSSISKTQAHVQGLLKDLEERVDRLAVKKVLLEFKSGESQRGEISQFSQTTLTLANGGEYRLASILSIVWSDT